MAELRRRSPGGMAVVTGRPRADCAKFLADFGLADLFDTSVCMEDGPAKPAPDAVLTACARLGVAPAAAVMVGDTPDDVRAAVAAGAVGVGVLTPRDAAAALLAGTATTAMGKALEECGAQRVLAPGLAGLLDVLAVPPPPAVVGGAPPYGMPRTAEVARAGQDRQHRVGTVSRKTGETQIDVAIDLDGGGTVIDVATGIGFLDHMLHALSKHGRMNLSLRCRGDLHVDDHHTAEDCAIALGDAFDKALGARKGIARFGSALAPLDEALARTVVDISSRPHSKIKLDLKREMIGAISTEMLVHVFESFATAARLTLHVDVLCGENDHHKAEAAFKSCAIALRLAVTRDAGAGIPSTKGYLE